jgi:uncharacterized membrane protein
MTGDGNPAVAEPLTGGFARTALEQEETQGACDREQAAGIAQVESDDCAAVSGVLCHAGIVSIFLWIF